ncbi:uncharacterized protein LOC131171187 [Hevea brasiliensis]|uniref:uncharacterized protein LOC131171187 n=1 Tax=Hevea brasiliensis TaxID=3981 RepID=UPI0025F46819|nr:uncharacterized protein LOC131171187 [Hevea brasiliensis]
MAANSNSSTPTPNPTPPNAQPETPISSPNPQIPNPNPSSPPCHSSHSTPNPNNATQDTTPPSQKHTKFAPSAVYETRKRKKLVLHSSASPKQPRVVSPGPVSARTRSAAQNSISPQVSSAPIRVQSPLHHSPTVSQTAPAIPQSGNQVNSSYPWTFREFEMMKKYEALAKKKILATKYIDEHSLREIGLYESQQSQGIGQHTDTGPSSSHPPTTGQSDLLVFLKDLEAKIDRMSAAQQPISDANSDIVVALKALEAKVDTLSQNQAKLEKKIKKKFSSFRKKQKIHDKEMIDIYNKLTASFNQLYKRGQDIFKEMKAMVENLDTASEKSNEQAPAASNEPVPSTNEEDQPVV